MVKEPEKGNESIVAKMKADAEAKKAEAEEAARIKAEQEKIDPNLDAKPADPELAKQAAEAAEKIEKADRDDNDVPVTMDNVQMDRDSRATAHAKGRVAAEKLRLIALSYPRTTSDEHVIFGFGGHRYTLGDLRDLTNIR